MNNYIRFPQCLHVLENNSTNIRLNALIPVVPTSTQPKNFSSSIISFQGIPLILHLSLSVYENRHQLLLDHQTQQVSSLSKHLALLLHILSFADEPVNFL